MKTRYFKVLRDLKSGSSRNLMLALSIAVGVFGIGTILGGYSVIKREMTDNYMGTVPASATIELKDSIPAGLTMEIEGMPEIAVAERHATVSARMKVGDQWHPLLLFVIDDFEDKQTNKVAHISGAKIPAKGSMLVERTALGVMKAVEGDELVIKTSQGAPMPIRLAGTVHDPSLAPAWQEQGGYGYITLSTLHWLGEVQGFDQLRLLVSEQQLSRSHITRQATTIADRLKAGGHEIHEIQVPPPGRHPHQSQMNTVMSIFVMFSFMILILGSILVSTSMATLMVRHVRQIGIMKTIGANSFQITKLYLFMMLMICAVALIVSVPLSQLAATGFYRQIATLLNIRIMDASIPMWVPLVQVGSGILIPFIAAAFPVLQGSRISIKRALDHFGVSQQQKASGVLMLRLSAVRMFSETFLLAVRNVFRQRKRLAMTLALLAAGGAMFMTALNVSEAWDDNLSRIYTQRLYDLDIQLQHPIPDGPVLQQLVNTEGVSHAEGWNQYSTALVTEKAFDVTQTYPDKGHGSFTLQALPIPTRLLDLKIVSGEWLQKESANAVVLNQLARSIVSGVKIGDHLSLSVDGEPTRWTVVGFTEDVGTPATAYVTRDALRKQVKGPDEVNMLRVAYTDRSKKNALEKNSKLEKSLLRESVPVSGMVPVWLLHSAIAAHMEVMINALLTMAILMALVGTVGLMSTMSMNVMERTREIGVMRAIGATPQKIRRLIVWEGLIIGVLSIFMAFALSVVISDYFGKFLGDMSFGTPLSLTLSGTGMLIWVLTVLIGVYVATYYPSESANRITTREALAYE